MITCSACGLPKERGVKCRHGLPEDVKSVPVRRPTTGVAAKADRGLWLSEEEKKRVRKNLALLRPAEEKRVQYYARGKR